MWLNFKIGYYSPQEKFLRNSSPTKEKIDVVGLKDGRDLFTNGFFLGDKKDLQNLTYLDIPNGDYILNVLYNNEIVAKSMFKITTI